MNKLTTPLILILTCLALPAHALQWPVVTAVRPDYKSCSGGFCGGDVDWHLVELMNTPTIPAPNNDRPYASLGTVTNYIDQQTWTGAQLKIFANNAWTPAAVAEFINLYGTSGTVTVVIPQVANGGCVGFALGRTNQGNNYPISNTVSLNNAPISLGIGCIPIPPPNASCSYGSAAASLEFSSIGIGKEGKAVTSISVTCNQLTSIKIVRISAGATTEATGPIAITLNGASDSKPLPLRVDGTTTVAVQGTAVGKNTGKFSTSVVYAISYL